MMLSDDSSNNENTTTTNAPDTSDSDEGYAQEFAGPLNFSALCDLERPAEPPRPDKTPPTMRPWGYHWPESRYTSKNSQSYVQDLAVPKDYCY